MLTLGRRDARGHRLQQVDSILVSDTERFEELALDALHLRAHPAVDEETMFRQMNEHSTTVEVVDTAVHERNVDKAIHELGQCGAGHEDLPGDGRHRQSSSLRQQLEDAPLIDRHRLHGQDDLESLRQPSFHVAEDPDQR